jgi:putative hydrolase of the HAD superfamily
MIRAVLFDFGGVLAEEGFREGLKALGRKHGLDPDEVFRAGREAAFKGGYTTGAANEANFWEAFRERTGINAPDEELRGEILDRFTLRPSMIEYVRKVKGSGCITCILSDQTNWLDELNEEGDFFRHFDNVFISYKMGKNKADPTLFGDVCGEIGVKPGEALFVDDSPGNIGRAKSVGLNVIRFTDIESFEEKLRAFMDLKESK